jgi:hypothetical protein
VPQVLRRRDDQAGGVVLVERAASEHVLAAALEFDPRVLEQALHADLVFEPLEFSVGDARHRMPPG